MPTLIAKNIYLSALTVICMITMLEGNQALAYNGCDAADYAEEWWDGTNPDYKTEGYDCTNFVSQCLHAGGMSMKNFSKSVLDGMSKKYFKKTYMTKKYWTNKKYKLGKIKKKTDFIRTSTWTLVDQPAGKSSYGLQDYLINKKNKTRNVIGGSAPDSALTKFIEKCEVGDVIQLRKAGTARFYHSLLVGKKKEIDGKIDICLYSHTGGRDASDDDSLRTLLDKGTIKSDYIIADINMN